MNHLDNQTGDSMLTEGEYQAADRNLAESIDREVTDDMENWRSPLEGVNVAALFKALTFVGVKPVFPKTPEGSKERFIVELSDGRYYFVGKKQIAMILGLVTRQTFCTRTVECVISGEAR